MFTSLFSIQETLGALPSDGGCLYCQVAVLSVQLSDGRNAESYRCLTVSTQETDGESEMSYALNLPSFFVNANKKKLSTGTATICITGGSAVRSGLDNPDPDVVIIPSGATISFVTSRHQRRLEVAGRRTTLVVHVSTISENPARTASELADATFGTQGQKYSMASQYNSCSAGKVTFIPGDQPGVSSGVLEINLSETIVDKNIFDLENTMTLEVKKVLSFAADQDIFGNALLIGADLKDMFDHVLFCLPDGSRYKASGTKNWLSYAYKPGFASYYSGGTFERLVCPFPKYSC